jgi:hypothetical protein
MKMNAIPSPRIGTDVLCILRYPKGLVREGAQQRAYRYWSKVFLQNGPSYYTRADVSYRMAF